jgi:hypothetical protein
LGWWRLRASERLEVAKEVGVYAACLEEVLEIFDHLNHLTLSVEIGVC